jgi:hypothetical protein
MYPAHLTLEHARVHDQELMLAAWRSRRNPAAPRRRNGRQLVALALALLR